MATLWIDELEIDPQIEDKPWVKHHVDVDEVEEVCFGQHRAERTRAGLYLILGQTDAGRFVAVILAPKGGGHWKIVSAREMTDPERRRYGRR